MDYGKIKTEARKNLKRNYFKNVLMVFICSVILYGSLTLTNNNILNVDLTNKDNVENVNNVRHGFTLDGSSAGELNPSVTMRKVTITATDNNGKQGSTEVYVIVRESFMLN